MTVTKKNKTAGPKKPIPTGKVFVVTTSRKLADLAVQTDKAVIASQRFAYDSYDAQSFGLDTVVTVTSFGTERKVARL